MGRIASLLLFRSPKKRIPMHLFELFYSFVSGEKEKNPGGMKPSVFFYSFLVLMIESECTQHRAQPLAQDFHLFFKRQKIVLREKPGKFTPGEGKIVLSVFFTLFSCGTQHPKGQCKTGRYKEKGGG